MSSLTPIIRLRSGRRFWGSPPGLPNPPSFRRNSRIFLQIDVLPGRHRASLKLLNQLSSSLRGGFTSDKLGRVNIVPADNRVLDEAFASFGDLLLDPVAVQKLVVVAERNCLRKLVRVLAFVELLLNRLPKLQDVDVAENEFGLPDSAEFLHET